MTEYKELLTKAREALEPHRFSECGNINNHPVINVLEDIDEYLRNNAGYEVVIAPIDNFSPSIRITHDGEYSTSIGVDLLPSNEELRIIIKAEYDKRYVVTEIINK
jgi:hypothetical protein